MNKHSNSISKSNLYLTSESEHNENSSILKSGGICDDVCNLSKTMTDDDLINRLFPEYISSS